MEYTDIDDIMHAVNNMNGDISGDDIWANELTNNLQQRTPLLRSSHNVQNINQNRASLPDSRPPVRQQINRPADPITSASSTDSSPCERGAVVSAQPVSKKTGNVQPNTHIITTSGKTQQRVSADQSDCNENRSNEAKDTGDKGIVSAESDTATSSHLTNLFGYNIPTSTLWFIFVLILITIALYLMTSEKKKDKEKKKEAE